MTARARKATVGAGDILDALRARHSRDVFFDEVKNGATHGAEELLKLDAWAMRRSWASPATYGYEIKVSRSDFLRDEKWHAYLPYCSQFYFVAPKDLLRAEEIPADVGLLELLGTRLLTRRKAVYRDVRIPEDLFRYLLMCRTQPGRDSSQFDDRESRSRFWRRWLEEKRDLQQLGWRASTAVRTVIRERIEEVESENRRLKAQADHVERAGEVLRELGLEAWLSLSVQHVRRELEKRRTPIDPYVIDKIQRLGDELTALGALLRPQDVKA